MANKTCKKCNLNKPIDGFHKRGRGSKDGYSAVCKLCRSQYVKDYNKKTNNRNLKRAENPEKARAAIRNWYKKNKDRVIKYKRDRAKTNLNCKLSGNLRSRLYQALKNNYKSGSAVKDLGCSIEKFKLWLEMHFEEGMTWKNYGDWHIDHITPLDSYNLNNRQELIKACNYTNLQPLWAEEKLIKSNKISEK